MTHDLSRMAVGLRGWLRRRRWSRTATLLLVLVLTSVQSPARAAPADVINEVRPSVVAVGTYQKTRNPAFQFMGTGFAVGDGSLIVTNAHVVSKILDVERMESLVVGISQPGQPVQFREVRKVAVTLERDLALLKLPGDPLKALRIREAPMARDGENVLFTGFPIGGALGLVPVTHRAMISAITPIAIPGGGTGELNTAAIRRLSTDPFAIYQLDGTAYPGNSGSPLYDESTGEVIGIVNMVFVKGSKESALSAPSGISYAIPAKYLVLLIGSVR